jgi:hypothetical protein
VDQLIDQLDNSNSTTSIAPVLMKEYHNPFAAFPTCVASSPALARPSTMSLSSPSFPEQSMEHFLFHHYVTHVARIMMPYDHPLNPWERQYPAAALGCRDSDDQALYDAVLAHSAYNLSALRRKDAGLLYVASKYYDRAIRKLLRRVSSGDLSFATTFTSILTLVMVEVYSGNTSKWGQHLQGARTLLQTAHDQSQKTHIIQTSVQSMHIIDVIGQTSRRCTSNIMESLINWAGVAPLLEVGFTIGAPKEIMQCISRITALGHAIIGGSLVDSVIQELQSIIEQLDKYQANRSVEHYVLMQYQTSAFITATKIYLHRVIFNAPPKSVRPLVSATLDQVSKFRSENNDQNFSIWLAFIAAVEAYTQGVRRRSF